MYFFTAIFIALMGYFVYYVQFRSTKAINSSYNMRQQNLAKLVIRGNVYSAGGDVLAEQARTKDGKEVRYYPERELFAHAVGYATHGGCGVEKAANISLLTSNAPLSERLRNEMAGQRNYGDNIYTTYDKKLQQAAYLALGKYQGAAIAMEAKTGKILALVSKPDFDPNKIDEEWDTINADSDSSALVNRAFQGLYPPGSTFKIVTLLEYLRENPDNYTDYRYDCKGKMSYDGVSVVCYHGSVHGSVDLYESFEKSCNCSFANMGTLINVDRFKRTAEGLLFNGELPLDLAYSKSSFVLSNESDSEELLQTAIGQGNTLVTPIHMAMITAAAANDGNLMVPYEIDHRSNYKGSLIEQYYPSSYGRIMTKEEATLEREFMERVVEKGTGKKLRGLSYTAAGKTGSAEYGTVKGNSHAWFTGYSNVEDPELVVTVILEGAGSGGDYAVPMARKIFDAYYAKK
ncbi:MAG: penicillin-binding protein 2 [Lachnospiraceae bacterium]|nr:penicillin-binding protein 2 [Lachnospiraceae bacterium]